MIKHKANRRAKLQLSFASPDVEIIHVQMWR